MALASLVFAPMLLGAIVSWLFIARMFGELTELGMRNHTSLFTAWKTVRHGYLTPAGLRYWRLACLSGVAGFVGSVVLAAVVL